MNKIIIMAYDFPSNNGGIAKTMGLLSKHCRVNNVPVKVITCSSGDTMDDIIRIQGRRGLLDIRMFRALCKTLQPGDVVVTDTYYPAGLMAVLTGYPTYIFAHGAELLPGKSFIRRTVYPVLRKWVYAKAVTVIANSHYTKTLVNNTSPKADVRVILPAIDINNFYPTKLKHNDGMLHLCSISRLEKFKAQDFVIDTIASMPENYRNRIRFTIGGKGPYKEVLEKMVINYGMQDIVTFKGFVADEEMCDFYSEHDAFVLCTREDFANYHVEGFGLVFVESQACGTPCIGSRTGGIPDAIDEGNGGWLINQDDKAALSKLLVTLLNNKDLLIEQGKKGRDRVTEVCNWNYCFTELMKLMTSNR